MAPKVGAIPAGIVDPTQEKSYESVSVTWIPHTTLSQTSHVCLTIRSAHVVLDVLSYPIDDNLPEWRMRVGVFGVAGLPLVPLQVHTTAAPVEKCGEGSSASSRVLLSKVTHACQWDTFVHVPIRWRDLPRDAYLLFEVLAHGDSVVYHTTMPFFSRYGKLKGGLQKLNLRTTPPDPHQNHGLVGSEDRGDDDDPVWEAVVLLDELERMKERARANIGAVETFGQTPIVPWLDSLEEERAKQVIAEALKEKDASSIV